jgi:DNA/RNA endonuclease YhcR with UshA esterase domain
MKTLLRISVVAFLLTGWLLSPSRADAPIVPDPDAWTYVGKNVTVEGVVTAVSTSKKGNTFINFEGFYPNQTFTGWVPARTDLAWDNLESLKGKKVKITGTIQLYQGKPEIKVLSKSQIAEE